MKLEDLAFSIVRYVFSELEHTHHYVVPEKTKRDIAEKVQKNLDSLMS